MFCPHCNQPLEKLPAVPVAAPPTIPKRHWLVLFVMLFVIAVAIWEPSIYVGGATGSAPLFALLATALGHAAGMFGLAFMLSLLGKPENQFPIVLAVSLVLNVLVAISKYGFLR